MRTLWRLLALLLLPALAGGCTISLSREPWQKPSEVIATLDLQPGSRVADLGAGDGYFTFRLADAVRPDGHVYAIDVVPKLTERLAKRAAERDPPDVSVILAPYDDPGLEAASVDVIFSCNTFHHIEDRVTYFRNAAAALRPAGRVVVIDMLPSAWLQRLTGHTIRPEVIRAEMLQAGYVPVREYDFLPEQSFIIFEVAP
jgi:arsenite methyltransferase